MQVSETIEAVFAPKDEATVKEPGRQFIGKRGTFEALWLIEDGRPRAGEWAMQIPEEWKSALSGVPFTESFLWVPSGDLIQH